MKWKVYTKVIKNANLSHLDAESKQSSKWDASTSAFKGSLLKGRECGLEANIDNRS